MQQFSLIVILVINCRIVYIFSLTLENLVDYLLKESKLPQVCWENRPKVDLMHIPVNGMPFILLSTREFQYYQGTDKNI